MFKNGKTKQGRKRVKNFVEFVKKRKTEWKSERKTVYKNGDVGKKKVCRKEF